jgi:hypothetical protein
LNYFQQQSVDQTQVQCVAPKSYPVQQQKVTVPQYAQQVVYLQQPIQQMVQQPIEQAAYIHLPPVQPSI